MLFSISIVRLASSSISSVIRSSSVPMRSNYNTISCDPLKSHQRITLDNIQRKKIPYLVISSAVPTMSLFAGLHQAIYQLRLPHLSQPTIGSSIGS